METIFVDKSFIQEYLRCEPSIDAIVEQNSKEWILNAYLDWYRRKHQELVSIKKRLVLLDKVNSETEVRPKQSSEATTPRLDMDDIISDLNVLSKKCERDIVKEHYWSTPYYADEFNRILEQAKKYLPGRFEDVAYVKVSDLSRANFERGSVKAGDIEILRRVDAEASKLVARAKAEKGKRKREPEILSALRSKLEQRPNRAVALQVKWSIIPVLLTVTFGFMALGWPTLPKDWQTVVRVLALVSFLAILMVIFWSYLRRLGYRFGFWLINRLSTDIDTTAMGTEPGLREPAIEKIEKHIEIRVPQDGHFVKMAYASRPISFKVLITNHTNLKLRITRISYEIYYQDIRIQIQEKKYEEPLVIEAEPIETPEYLDYLPFEAQTGIPKLNRGWGIKGTISIDSEHGSFEKSFESPRKLTIDTDNRWQEAHEYYIKTRG